MRQESRGTKSYLNKGEGGILDLGFICGVIFSEGLEWGFLHRKSPYCVLSSFFSQRNVHYHNRLLLTVAQGQEKTNPNPVSKILSSSKGPENKKKALFLFPASSVKIYPGMGWYKFPQIKHNGLTSPYSFKKTNYCSQCNLLNWLNGFSNKYSERWVSRVLINSSSPLMNLSVWLHDNWMENEKHDVWQSVGVVSIDIYFVIPASQWPCATASEN